MAGRPRGPICATTAPPIDHGTLCRSTSQSPGPAGRLFSLSRSIARRLIEEDAFDLCVTASACGFIPAVTQPVVDRTLRAMRGAFMHFVPTLTEFEAVVEEYSAALFFATAEDRDRFLTHHRQNFDTYHITGQTVYDTVLGDAHIVIVGSYALRTNQVLVQRHERAHVGLNSLGVPGAQQHRMMEALGLGSDRLRRLGIPVGLSHHRIR